jgi:hypothetical protein
MQTSLLDQALAVAPSTRMTLLKSLTPAQLAELQSEIKTAQVARGITPTPPAATAAQSKMSRHRYNSIRSGSLIGSKRVIRVGFHLVMIPAQAAYKKTRDNLCYVHYKGVISGWSARGAKLTKLKLSGATKAHVARTLFNVRT